MNSGRDYIVEYQTGQFQRGSLVLRFDDNPSDSQIRAALIRQGLPERALEKVSARPQETGRMWDQVQHRPAPPDPPQAARTKRSRPPLLGVVLILLVLFAGQMMRSEDAITQGRMLGHSGGSETCLGALERTRDTADPEDGIFNALLSTSPTAYLLTPANAAFLLACNASNSG